MYRLSIAGVIEDHDSLDAAISRAKELVPTCTPRSGASGGAVHHYTTLHTPRSPSDPIGEQIGIIAWPGMHHLVVSE